MIAVIGFPHAEHVAIRATRGVANDNHSLSEHVKRETMAGRHARAGENVRRTNAPGLVVALRWRSA